MINATAVLYGVKALAQVGAVGRDTLEIDIRMFRWILLSHSENILYYRHDTIDDSLYVSDNDTTKV